MSINMKLCGNRSLIDLKTSIESGAEYIGVVFADSKRQVDPEELAEWLKQIQFKKNQKLVGVFVNPTIGELDGVMKNIDLDVIQLHGNEDIAHVLNIKERFPCTIWKAIHHTDASVELMNLYKGVIDGYVVDAKSKEAWGGTGKQFDWKAVPQYIEEAEMQSVPCFIAGGVNPENVFELASLKPHGIDVSSGIESEGKKDANKIEKIMRRSKHVSHIS
ncbi:phosphoribosylanthranilate isomerase [Pontibacillus sp. HMF3514]|uniref:phosphoribosylanthranilate isomerase n=1 Tax=Pontibacillus sp. HMF3514 TaxID=2692425 RepID=UPI00131FC474|nr:phosphoribosylanthranilate isomerase [Pontibacillus sp. HMF3514]QHE51093.1 phosphoribosylanthranilate isomerase [Pontibacillus sp. HMF3514]